LTDRIVLREEALEASYVPESLPHREAELKLLRDRFAQAATGKRGWSQLLTGGIGSGKTVMAQKLQRELASARYGDYRTLYVNCWRRNSDRTVLLELLKGVGYPLPDRGYSLPEMVDTLEAGIRRVEGNLLVILDEVTSLFRQGTRLVYLLTRGPEVGLGRLSLLLIAPQDVLPLLDPATRSGFGVTHRLHLPPYSLEALTDILLARGEAALRPGSLSPDVATQIARVAAAQSDARLALELLEGAARRAEQRGGSEIGAEDVRWSKASLYPTFTEGKLEGLSPHALLVLLALARTLKSPGTWVGLDRVRSTYATVAEEFGTQAQSRVTFWRTVKALEREGLVSVDPQGPGQAAKVSQDEMPVSLLELVLQERLGRAGPRVS
jgi:cell division control protein 6